MKQFSELKKQVIKNVQNANFVFSIIIKIFEKAQAQRNINNFPASNITQCEVNQILYIY